VGDPISPVIPEAAASTPVAPDTQRIRSLETLRDSHERQLEDLHADIARLRSENDALRNRVSTLEARIPRVASPELPWALLNPLGVNVTWTPAFAGHVRSIARDGGLGAEVHKKIEAALADPTGYGKEMGGARKGQRGAYVANNYRLVWSATEDEIRFILCVSKEDPEYSPHGA
jgi:hypothetical protein